MTPSAPPKLPSSGGVPIYGIEAVQFFSPVSLGILVALFGVVTVSGGTLVLHSSGAMNAKVDDISTATAQDVAEPDVPSDQPVPASPTNETPATDIPEVSNKDHESDSRVVPKADEIAVAERRILAALSEQSVAKFAECPLVDAMEFLSRQHAIPILLDIVAIEEAGLLVDEPINLVLAGVTLRSVLNIMLSDLELTFLIEDEVMKITTVEVASKSSATRSDQIAKNATTIASERRIKEALSDEASVNFADTPLVDAIEFIQRRHQIPILLDIVAIEETGLLVDEPINLVLAGVTLRSVLNIMLSDLELTFLIEDEVMKITTVEVAQEKSATRVNVTEDRKLVEQSDDASLGGNRETVIPKRPLDDVRTKEGLLPIATSVRDQKTVDLCTIGGVPADSIQLELVGNEFADGSRVTITKGGDVDAPIWSATQYPSSALGRQMELGQFVFKDDQLSFLAASNSRNSLLHFCMLRISTLDPNDTELCRLWKPLQLQDLPVSFANSRAVYNLIPDELPQLSLKSLRTTIETDGYGECGFPDGKEASVERSVSVDVVGRGLSRRNGKLFTTRFSLTAQDSRPVLVVSHVVELPQMTIQSSPAALALSEQPLSLAALSRQHRDVGELIKQKSKLLNRVSSFTTERRLRAEERTLREISKSLVEMKKVLESVAVTGRIGVRLVRRISDENEIVILQTQLFSDVR